MADDEDYWAKKPGQKSWWERRDGETEEEWHARIQNARFLAFDPDEPDIPLD